MPHPTDLSCPDDTTGPRVTRRSVVRAAGHAAWAAPIVVAATAAPAMAASGPARMSVSIGALSSSPPAVGGGGPGSNNSHYAFDLPATLTNLNTQPSTGLIVTVSITVADPAMLGYVQATADGYNFGQVTGATGSGTQRTLTFTADQQVGRNGSKAFRAFVYSGSPVDPCPGSNNASFTVTATPGAPGTSGAATAVCPTSPPSCALC